MNGYVLSVDAEFDLDDIWEYIAADNIAAADRWIEKLFDTLVVGQFQAVPLDTVSASARSKTTLSASAQACAISFGGSTEGETRHDDCCWLQVYGWSLTVCR